MNVWQGDSDIDQLGKIFQKLGTPTPSQWPDLEWLPDFVEYSSQTAQPWRKLCPTASDDALDLLSKLFTYDPKTRITVQQALEHRFAKSFNLKNLHYHWFPALIFVSLLGTLHLYLCPQIRLSFRDQPLRENLTTQGLQIYMRVLLSCHQKRRQEEWCQIVKCLMEMHTILIRLINMVVRSDGQLGITQAGMNRCRCRLIFRSLEQNQWADLQLTGKTTSMKLLQNG